MVQHQHGDKGAYYGGNWVDLEDCVGSFIPDKNCLGQDCPHRDACPRSRSRNQATSARHGHDEYDIIIVGAGCIGSAIARELSKFKDLDILWLEAADDVSQGATKGNSGIVHAGYDDKPGTNRAKFCWKGNQMFAELDKELRFGYQKNGSLVVAFSNEDRKHLVELLKRGEANGVQRLRIVEKEELHQMEPHIHPDAIAALYSPDAGNVIPYEFAIALAENAVDNGVELRIRRTVQDIKILEGNKFQVTAEYWEPAEYVEAMKKSNVSAAVKIAIMAVGLFVVLHLLIFGGTSFHLIYLAVLAILSTGTKRFYHEHVHYVSITTPIQSLVKNAGKPLGKGGTQVEVSDMLTGGSGSSRTMKGQTVAMETYKCDYVINCAGGAADRLASLIGDYSFKIKPRLGDYILLNRNQVKTWKMGIDFIDRFNTNNVSLCIFPLFYYHRAT